MSGYQYASSAPVSEAPAVQPPQVDQAPTFTPGPVQTPAQSTPTLDAMPSQGGPGAGGGGPQEQTTGEVLDNPVSVSPSNPVPMVDGDGEALGTLGTDTDVIVLTQPNVHYDEYSVSSTEVEDRRVAVLVPSGQDDQGRTQYTRAYVDDNELDAYDDNRTQGTERGETGLPSLGGDSEELPFTTGEDIENPPTTTVSLPEGSETLEMTGLDGQPVANLPADAELIVLTQPSVHYDDYMVGEGDEATLDPDVSAEDRMAMVVWTDANGTMHTGYVDDAYLAAYPDNRSNAEAEETEPTQSPTETDAVDTAPPPAEDAEVAADLLNDDGVITTGEAIENPPVTTIMPTGDTAAVHDSSGNPIGELPADAEVRVMTQPTTHFDDWSEDTTAADRQVMITWTNADGDTQIGYLDDNELAAYADNRSNPAEEGGNFDIDGVHLPLPTSGMNGAILWNESSHTDAQNGAANTQEFDFNLIQPNGQANPMFTSAGPGEVVFVKDTSDTNGAWDYNNVIVVAHTNPEDETDVVYSWYAHGAEGSTAEIWDEELGANRPLQPGDWVDQGDALMQEGNTGQSGADHLHFAMTSDAPDFSEFYDEDGNVPDDAAVWYDDEDLLDVSFAEGDLEGSTGYCTNAAGNVVDQTCGGGQWDSNPLPAPSTGGSMTWDRDGDGTSASLSHNATGPSTQGTAPTVPAPETGTALSTPETTTLPATAVVVDSSGDTVSMPPDTDVDVLTEPNASGQSLVTWTDPDGAVRTGYVSVNAP